MLQAFCDVTSLFTFGPGAVRPPPKVDSAVMRLVPRDPALIGIDDRKRFADVVRAAFGQRRKTLRNALRNVCDEDAMRAAGVDPQARAEQLEVADFVRLAHVVELGSASCRERVCQYVYISVVAVSLKK